MPYLSASAVVIHYEEALYQVYAPYLYPFTTTYRLTALEREMSTPPTLQWSMVTLPLLMPSEHRS